MGNALVIIGVATALASVTLYVFAKVLPNLMKVARWLFAISAIATVGVQAFLIYLITTRRYDIWYVFSHSDNSLPPLFRISAVWAGQEGSFLLWAFFTAVLGVIALRSLGRYERNFMIVYGLILASILGILALQSPFTPTRIIAEKELALKGIVLPADWASPINGQGMNPALENYWMAIHPPIIFIGFAMLGILFAYSIAALSRKDWDQWVYYVRPWVVGSMAILGLGIVLGGLWAYETLGWGGFWAWDPVENVSLLPWLACAALIHGIHMQIARGRMRWANLLLGGIPFILFIYGTYVTRSGVLSNLSVHAFAADLAKGAISILLWLCHLSLALLIGFAFWRLKAIINSPVSGTHQVDNALSKDKAIFAGVIGLIITLIIVSVGTFLPLAQILFHAKPMKIEQGFYLKAGAIVIIPIALLMAIGPLMRWRGMKGELLLNRILLPWMLSFLFAVFALFLWMPPLGNDAQVGERFLHLIPLIVSTLLFFAVAANIFRMRKTWKVSKISTGGFITHVGVGLLMMGLIVSTVGENKKTVTLQGSEPQDVFGYSISFAKMSSNINAKTNRVVLKLKDKSGKISEVKPLFYESESRADEEGQPMVVRAPWIKWSLFQDLYFALSDNPQQVSANHNSLRANLKKGETGQLGPYSVKFIGYDTQEHSKGTAMGVGARLEVSYQGHMQSAEPRTDGQNNQPAQLEGGAMAQVGIDADNHAILLELYNVPGHPETNESNSTPSNWIIPLEIRYKPMTILVWLGSLLLLVGGLVSVRRRSLDLIALGKYGENLSASGHKQKQQHKGKL